MSKKLLSALLLSGLLLTAAYAADQTQIAAWNQKLHDPDPKVRIAASERLGGESPEAVGNDLIPLLLTALSDPEPKVRSNAAATLHAIALYTLPKSQPLAPGATDIKGNSQVQEALLKAMRDPLPETRQSALAAYLLTYPVDAALQDKLVDRFTTERDDPLIQQTIIGALVFDGAPTDKANALLNSLVTSPVNSYKVAQAVVATTTPPDNLLPQLVKQLSSTEDKDKRGLFAGSVAQFGSKAKP